MVQKLFGLILNLSQTVLCFSLLKNKIKMYIHINNTMLNQMLTRLKLLLYVLTYE